jgi:DNA-binding transcriptional LysR family regulator
MDLLAKMETYVRVVESGKISAAARQLGISAPAVSRQIATLERELRTSLVTRTTRKLTVTARGQWYYQRCVGILREVEETHRIQEGDGVAGIVKVTAPVTFGLACVAPQVGALMKKHPALLVELTLEDRLVDLMPEGYDVAIRVGSEPPVSSALVARRLMTYRRTLVASPGYLRAHAAPTRPEGLARHHALMHVAGPSDSWLLQSGKEEVRVRPRVVFRSNALHVLSDLALQGAGVALLPGLVVRSAVAEGRLRRVLPAWHSTSVNANAIWRMDQRGSKRVQAVVEHLRASLENCDETRPISRVLGPA